jgi:adenosine deaminase
MKTLTPEMISKLPKIELHRHIEGSFHVPTLYKMAQKNGLDFPPNYKEFAEAMCFPHDATPNFALFLSKFYNTWYDDLDDVHAVVYNSMLNIDNNENLFYAEVRFNPFHYCINKGFDPAETLNTFLQASRTAIKDSKKNINLLLTINRGFYDEMHYIEVFKDLIKKVDFNSIVGVDLAGDEVNFPPEKFKRFFDYIHSELGYPMTIHAGEVTDAQQIRTAIDMLHAQRIGHGVKLIDDPALIAQVKEQRIAFEMCPISNYQTSAHPIYATHPIKQLFNNGVLVTLNSDDPTVQGTTLNDDYTICHQYLGFGLPEFKQLNLNSIEASFLNDADKCTLKARFNEQWQAAVLSL